MEDVVEKDALEFDTPENLLARHPEGHRYLDGEKPPVPGRGTIGDAVLLPDGTRCAIIYLGCARHAVISEHGVYLGDDEYVDVVRSSVVEKGAWLPESLYHKALQRFKENPLG